MDKKTQEPKGLTEEPCAQSNTKHVRNPIQELEYERTMLINRLCEIEKKIQWIKNNYDVQRFLEEFPHVSL